jgi:hypothetical protein
MMQRLSSSWTIFFKLFVPVFWVVFFTTLGIATLTIGGDSIGIFSTSVYQWGLLIFLVSGYVFLFFTFYQLKRVDADDQYVYISNYFKTFRYPYSSIKGYRVSRLILFKLVRLHFTKKGSLGKSIVFLPSRSHFAEFARENALLIRLND